MGTELNFDDKAYLLRLFNSWARLVPIFPLTIVSDHKDAYKSDKQWVRNNNERFIKFEQGSAVSFAVVTG